MANDLNNSSVGCKCSTRIRLVGDGCQFCNPKLAAEINWNNKADELNQWDTLSQEKKLSLIARQIKINKKQLV